MKRFLKWFFEPYEARKKKRSVIPGKVILCHGCQKIGYRAQTPFREWECWEDIFEYRLPSGWKTVWVGLKPLYLCENCLAKRREQWSYVLNK